NQQNQMSAVVTKDRIFKTFAQSFLEVSSKADVALRFEYLPINTSCAGSGACVQTLSAAKELVPSPVPGVSTMQFFNDESGTLTNRGVVDDSGAGFQVANRTRLSLPANLITQENFVTWPLTSPSSPPFVIMRRNNTVSDYFFVAPAFAADSSSDWVIVQGTRAGVPVDQIKNRPIVAYDTNDFTKYMVRRVVSALDCSLPASKPGCVAAATSLVPSFVPNAAFSTSNYYALELAEYSAGDLAGFIPPISPPPSSWPNQDPAIYLFPTHQSSLTWAGPNNPSPNDFTAPVTVSKLSHAEHVLPPAQQGSIALMPVDLVRYYFQDILDSSKKPTGRMQMHMQVLGTKDDMAILDQLPVGSSIVFTRRLGTTEIGVLEMQ
ncbi:MAG: hypothetical protein ACXVB9_19650, partial [Bdellovibrionota bacterium]